MNSKPLMLWTPQVIFSDPKLSFGAKFVLAEILNLFKAGNDGCWASNGHFAELFNISKRMASYYIAELEKNSWIKTEVIKDPVKGWIRYIIALPSLLQILHSLSQELHSPITNVTDPMKVPGTIKYTKKNTREILDKSNMATAKSIDKRNVLVEFALKRFKDLYGFEPTDQKPRFEAYNLVRRITSMLKERNRPVDESAVLKAIGQYFDWVEDQEWSEKVQNLGTIRRKLNIFDSYVQKGQGKNQ